MKKKAGQQFTHYRIYSRDNSQYPKFDNYLNIASFDPGSRNLGLRIERRSSKVKYLDTTETVLLINKDIKGLADSDPFPNYILNLTSFLDSVKEYLEYCHFIIVEYQMPKNYTTLRLSQHIITQCWLYCQNNNRNTWIIEIDPKLKGDVLHAPRGVDLKKWGIQEAIKLSQEQGDNYTIQRLSEKGKRDELSDCTIQIQAFLIKIGFINYYKPLIGQF